MRPLALSLTGFRSYPTTVTVEFTGRSLVAALGDTGAGKSSLLDAIVFALFRKSSWDAKEPRQLIADGAQAMSVELTFLEQCSGLVDRLRAGTRKRTFPNDS